MHQGLRYVTVDPIARARLLHELRNWRRIGCTPRIWWRDDDARAPSAELARLLTAANGLPLALAIIPDGDLPALSDFLKCFSNVTVGQHGVNHVDRHGAEGSASEYPPNATVETIREELHSARDRMLGAGLVPTFYTPPWNLFEDRTLEALPAVGYSVVSAGADPPEDSVTFISAQVDIMRWKGGARFRGSGRVLEALRRQLRSRRLADCCQSPIGLLTHHLAHDERAWRFLDWFLAFSQSRFTWRSIDAAASERGARGGREGRGYPRST